MNELNYEEALSLGSTLFVDVRAPVEYAQDHIPGAVNIPVFDDNERALVGTMYRIQGQESAIIKGTEMVADKLSGIIEKITKLRDRNIVVTCFRGGMRSSALVSLLSSLGIEVYKLRDGYKGYRRYIRSRIETLTIEPPLFVLHGLTGTGKTEILRRLPNSIDLEGCAGHRSSVFGGMGLIQNTQKMFESLLVHRIDSLKSAPYAVIEGESRKIGDIHVPEKLMKRLTSSPGILISATMERRVEILMQEYREHAEPGKVIKIVTLIEGRIGKKNAALLADLLKSGNIGDFIRLLLEKYYDPLYRHSLDAISYIAHIENESSESSAGAIQAVIEKQLAAGRSG